MAGKDKNVRRHFRARLIQRVGIKLTPEIEKEFFRQIKEGEAEKVLKESIRKYHYRLTYEGKTFVVVVDKKRRQFITVIPKNY